MKCKDCDNFIVRTYGYGARKSYDGHECKITGVRVSEKTVNAKSCPLPKKSVDPDDKFVRID